MKIFKSVMHLLILAALVGAAYLSGIYSVKYQRNIEENKSTITTIAVVNADIGSYASELICYPDTNFETASLTAAKEGILNDRYAAYILIPEDFSANVESVNEKPVKSQITYAVSNRLRQDAQFKVVNDIHNFIVNLNANVSYMYVDAILKEIHGVQDDSNSIMLNDIADMEAIVGVENAELIEAAVYEPLEVVETEIQYLDLSDDYEKLSDAVSVIDTTYESNVESAMTELDAIREMEQGVYDEISAMSEVFAEVDILTDTDGNIVYEEGMDHVLEYPDEFVETVNQKKLEAKIKLGFKEGDEEPEKPKEPDKPDKEKPKEPDEENISEQELNRDEASEKELSEQKSDEDKANEEASERTPAEDESDEDESGEAELNEQKPGEELNEQQPDEEGPDIRKWKKLVEKEPEEEEPEEPVEDTATKEGLLAKISRQIEALEELKDDNLDKKHAEQIDDILEELGEFYGLFEEYYTNAIIAINDIPDAEAFVQGIRDIYSDEIVAPVDEETAAEAERVESAVSSASEAIETYVSELEEYDFMEYLEEEKIQEQLDSLYKTIDEMEEEIIETDDAYIAYIEEIVTTADSNTEMLQENLDVAYEQTVTNIENTMDGFKQNRADLNAENVFLLNDITEKLPYTRLGNLEYIQVYDFIASPLESNDESVIKVNLSPTAISIDLQDLICLFIGIIALIMIYIGVQLIYRKKSDNGEEGEIWQTE